MLLEIHLGFHVLVEHAEYEVRWQTVGVVVSENVGDPETADEGHDVLVDFCVELEDTSDE